MADEPIYRQPTAAPAVHALVIGVGHYPHLSGGGGKTLTDTEGMGQLTSAPASAREFAHWLLSDLHHPDGRPLASLRLLVSDKSRKPFKHPKLAAPVRPIPATVDEVKRAVSGWIKDLDDNPDHLGVFFFSGHGVAAGINQALLLSDYGADELNPFDASINLPAFHFGMSRAKTREQVYFIDACRSHSEALADSFDGVGGQVFIKPDKTIVHARPRVAPIFNATLLGEKAYGQKDKPSLFTQALLDSLKGGGSDNIDDEAVWLVETATLMRSLEFLVANASQRVELDKAQVTPTDSGARVRLHVLPGAPLIPVAAEFIPEVKPRDEKLRLSSGNLKWGPKDPPPLLPYGPNDFTADSPGPPRRKGELKKSLRPPYGLLRFTLQEIG